MSTVIDKGRFEARGGYGCSNSDYHLHRTTCCGCYGVEDDELLQFYTDPTDLTKSIDLGYSPRHGEQPPVCPFCGACAWEMIEVTDCAAVPQPWQWAAGCR